MTEPTVLPGLLRRESRSFLQYVRDSFPWAAGRDVAVRDALLRMADAEAEHHARLLRLLQKRHAPLPALGAYPSGFTNSNFLAARALVPRLLAAQRQAVADLERDLAAVTDDEARAALEALRDLKRRHLAELEALAEGQPAAAGRAP